MNKKTMIFICLSLIIIPVFSFYIYSELSDVNCTDELIDIMKTKIVLETPQHNQTSGSFSLSFDEDFTQEEFEKLAKDCMNENKS